MTPAWIGEVALVALGGALGASSRYGVQQLGWFDHNPYYYTVVINLSGCLIMGVLFALFSHMQAGRSFYLFFLTGLLGGYTTYAAFSLDAMTQWEAGRLDITLFYIALTLFGGLGATAFGLWITRLILKHI